MLAPQPVSLPAGALPAHADLVADLRRLREKGLIRLRAVPVPALEQATQVVGADTATAGAPMPTLVEELLRAAVAALGTEEIGTAAAYLFGLVQGTVGRAPTDLRERAAQEYGLSAETFRKEPERLLVARVADEILLLCRRAGARDRLPRPRWADVRDDLARAEADLGDGAGEEFGAARYGPYPMPCGEATVPFWVEVGKVEYLHDVDVVVSAENAYLEPARMFTATLSGAIRRAAAERDDAGKVVRDVVADELAAWVREHGSVGQPFEPGIVAPTSPGTLEQQGIRRLYHAAAAVPQVGSHDYVVTGENIVRSIHSVASLLTRERELFTPPLASFSVPLFGAGYGRRDPGFSFDWVWRALQAALTGNEDWTVHLTVLGGREAIAVLTGLNDRLKST